MTDSQTSKFRTIDKEQYYTPWATAADLVAHTFAVVGHNFNNYIEPSAGKGSFLYFMPPDSRIGIDIDPLDNDEIVKQDFFTFEFPKGRNIVIGNPPFGRRGQLAMKFLNRCSEHCDVVALILPAVFSKYTFINRVHPNMHLMDELSVTEFEQPDNPGEGPKVNCVFQVWQKTEEKREKIVKETECRDFRMVHRHLSRTSPEELELLQDHFDFTLSQIEGKVHDVDVTKGSQWFIKDFTVDLSVRKVMERFDFSDKRQHHTGAVSLTQADVVERYLEMK